MNISKYGQRWSQSLAASMVVAAVPARAIKTGSAATVPVPVSAVWIAMLAHCAGRSARNQSGSAPGKTEARSKTDASPA
ncbi:MAG: hypothetical protein NWP69_10845, partial [Congregibacter sp.]|nr:hypothetical protein [Congregibacter sp.]